ncbi:MAG: Ldh family oxidoreductase [Actinobacteria bacterium]|nr:Ldh family oxidoreductase [Actinomycetota bacterium]
MAIEIGRAQDLAADILGAVGAPDEVAREVAEHLVDADRSGHGSHGVGRLPWYVKYVREGVVRPQATPEVIDDSPATVVDGRWGFSHPAARLATDLACERARDSGLAMVGVTRCTHLGRLGAYMERAAAADCIAIAFLGGLGGSRLVAPFGGARGLLGSNPLAAGFPSASGMPLVVDFATAAMPIGKVMIAAQAGRRLPSPALIDREGHPTDDPMALEEGGAMRVFGDNKGFGLAVLIELLGRVLVAAPASDDDAGGPSFRRQGLLLVAIAADAFRALSEVLDDAARLQDDIHAVAAADGFERVLAPGEPEHDSRARHSTEIEIPAGTWTAICKVATEIGLPETALPEARST